MSEMMSESGYEASRRESQRWAYDRMAREQAERDREDRIRGYVDIGGYNVPYHLQGLVLEHGVHPDKVCAIADLFESDADFVSVMGAPDHLGKLSPIDGDPRVDEVQARFARVEADEAARQQSDLFPER